MTYPLASDPMNSRDAETLIIDNSDRIWIGVAAQREGSGISVGMLLVRSTTSGTTLSVPLKNDLVRTATISRIGWS